MRRTATVLVLATLLVGAMLAGSVLLPGSYYQGPGIYFARCPLTVTRLGLPLVQPAQPPSWTIAISDAHKTAAQVRVSRSRAAPPDARGGSCELNIVKLPRKPLEGTDWRIGYIVKNVDPGKIRGGAARVTMALKADRPIAFGAAAIYAYDGVGVKGSLVIPQLGEEWQTYTLQVPVDPKATTFEAWLRLAIHNSISTTGTVYMANAAIDLH